jgi:GTP 3',8-cyclase
MMINMQDTFGRTINYLRLSITDRCNLRCRYCMPAAGVQLKECGEILRYEDFLRIVSAAANLGIYKVRVTGGEPLVRKGVLNFLERVAATPGIEELALTTNGLRLGEQAQALKNAGVQRLNISLDSLQPDTFATITRGGSLSRVLKGLEAAEAAGLGIKLNMVVMRGINDAEVLDFAALSRTKPWAVRFIEYMPTLRVDGWGEKIVSGTEILDRLRRHYPIQALSTGRSCGPAKPYRIAGATGTLGIITPISEHFCGACNRIRVTATGLAKSCLLNDEAIDLKPHLRRSRDDMGSILRQVVDAKPAQHQLDSEHLRPAAFSMASIGG